MFENKTIGFIGAGNMGSAMIGGLVNSETVSASQIIAADVNTQQLESLKNQFSITIATDNQQAAQADIVVISVKPQVLPDIGVQASQADFVLSIAAGVSIAELHTRLGNNRIVRVMPNTPAMIGEGMSVWTATPSVTAPQKAQAQQILASLGQQMEVHKESLLDAATAMSGSGPAYVFLFMEAMVEAGVHLGFSRAQAEKLAIQTVKGSALYAEASAQPLPILRGQVTSPAGTTAEALYHMEKLGLRHAVARGIWAANQRSIELGGAEGRNPDS